MKKIVTCLLLVLVMCLPLVLTSCHDDEDIVEITTKPLTMTLYGITGESTTEEAILAVQDRINEYTEGKFNTHIILRLFPESEYYKEIETRLAALEQKKIDDEAEAKRKKEEERKAKKEGRVITAAPTTEAVTTEVETYAEHGVIKTVYSSEKGTQVDIFMVQGAAKLNMYFQNGWLSPLSESLANDSKLINKYIRPDLLDTTKLEVTVESDGTVSRGTVYGIPNNNIFGEYTYLLINKAIADEFWYAPEDVATLANLQYFLIDAKRDYSDYITLYNEPTFNIEYMTENPSLLGGIVSSTSKAYSRSLPRDLLNVTSYMSGLQYIYDWTEAGYLEKGDYYSLPEDKNVAAAFIKGDVSTPELYEDDYYVITYQTPTATRNDRPGTMFCVSSYTSNVERCMEIITDLETVSSFRDIFQYGVEGTHFNRDEYTDEVIILNHDYSMDPANTGNLFIMTPNNEMSDYMKKMSANNWELAKKQNMAVINSPFVCADLRIITEDNYKTTSRVWKEMYDKAYEEASKAEDFDPKSFTFDEPYPFEYTDVILRELEKLSAEYIEKINSFVEYDDENGDTITLKDYIKIIRKEFDANEWYQAYTDADNADALYQQYNSWYTEYGPKADM